ncbi:MULTISPECIES: HNH endonuclease [Cyanophyceae]|uniref:HNH endonuclease n=1 Tax=Cyanophyceae TaxID=3028117 RepID=UPI00168675E0|nr:MULTISPECIES: HNH endonuclease [Cyanophyceae]MBD1914834.1 HNH endonuclease [Phormidium sp. FACHB-77]MBD2029952.1 HNH endonuclease [Phormidium sp. FACHB-322]MBD2049262.1 HNH endonuclease [Leptolyngbya sp. FACHB-60]
MATWDHDIVTALSNLGGSASYDAIYAEIDRLRDNLPQTWKAVVRRRIQDLSSDSAGFKNGDDLFFSVKGLGSGIWGLRSFVRNTPTASDLPLGNPNPHRVPTQTYRVLRDTDLARKIKLFHRNCCQICGLAIPLSDGSTYAEAHHIKPLGSPHHGPDTAANILVLCPNHHVLCDYGAISLQLNGLRVVQGHSIDPEMIAYHNYRFASKTQRNGPLATNGLEDNGDK